MTDAMNTAMTALGYGITVCAGWTALLVFIALLVRASNYVSHQVLESYGGWRTFREYQKWYSDVHTKQPLDN
jgi:hypothetical protein